MRRAALGAVAYLALVLSLATPLYEPLASGRDDTWAVALMIGAAHVALGAAVGRGMVLAAPLIFAGVLFLANGAEALAWLIVIFGAPVLFVLTGVGWALSRLRARTTVAAAAFAIAAAPGAWAAVEHGRRGPHVPSSVQRALPTETSLGNLCSAVEVDPDRRMLADVRRRAETLVRELRRNPQHTVTYTYYWSDGPDERRDITVRELAEEQLDDLDGGGCEPELRRRLRALL